MPCTFVNAVIGLCISGAIGVGVAVFTVPAAGGVATVAMLGVCLLAIYFRGYLVPGTPELTKRYFPSWLLGMFGKNQQTRDPVTDIDPERELLTAGALEECRDRDDLCLTAGFREAWYDQIDAVESADADRNDLLDLLDMDDADVSYREYGDAFIATIDGEDVGKWESEEAFLADLGAARALKSVHPRWELLSVQAKSQLLNGLRLFIDACPTCGSEPSFATDTVESCCSTHEVAAVTCPDCETRLFETTVQ